MGDSGPRRPGVATTLDESEAGAPGADGDLASTRPRAISPAEQVEQRLQVTSPRMWLALLAFAAIIVSSIVWGVFGRAADEVHGHGTLLPAAGLYDIAVPLDGIVDEVKVSVGDQVSEGQSLVSLNQPRGETEEVKSAVSGKVVSLLVKRGTFVKAGTPVATIEPQGSELEGLLYVPAAAGKRVKPGMQVFLSPSTASSSQFGSMVGTVVDVSSLTVTPERLDLTLGNDSPLADQLLSGGPTLEVLVRLERADTSSGFVWSASRGPDFSITSGTLIDGSVVIAEGSPTKQILGG